MNYRIQVSYSPEDEAYIATVPALPGCAADGETADQAVKNVCEALEGHLAAREANKMSTPEDPLLEQIRKLHKLLNLSEIAQEAGINKSTLRMKIKRGTPFTAEESARITHTLESKGLQIA